MTRATDLTAVSQGRAAGCLHLGVLGVTSDSAPLRFAFRKAWRSWSAAARFPTIGSDLMHNDIETILAGADARQGIDVATWVRNGSWFSPRLRPAVDLTTVGNRLTDYGTAWGEWQLLAGDFVADFRSGDLRRDPFLL